MQLQCGCEPGIWLCFEGFNMSSCLQCQGKFFGKVFLYAVPYYGEISFWPPSALIYQPYMRVPYYITLKSVLKNHSPLLGFEPGTATVSSAWSRWHTNVPLRFYSFRNVSILGTTHQFFLIKFQEIYIIFWWSYLTTFNTLQNAFMKLKIFPEIRAS